MIESFLPRSRGDIQAAVVALVAHLAPVVPVPRQPGLARKIAQVIASRRSTMRDDMFLRQSIVRGRTATHDDVIEGMAAWVTVLFDLDNLQHDRLRALDLAAMLPDDAVDRLVRAVSTSRNGCILAVPHIGSIELFAAHLRDRGLNLGFVYTIGSRPTPVERWIYRGRSATRATPIAFGRRSTGAEIAKILGNNGVVLMVVDVYPSDRFRGIHVKTFGDEFNYPPGPARYARSGTLVLPGFASRRQASGFSMNILDPIDYPGSPSVRIAACDFTQRLAAHIGGFVAEQPAAYWLWHPIPNDPFLAAAKRRWPHLLPSSIATLADDEAVALAVDAAHATYVAAGVA
ncbi:MAG: lysophospholipid acyltransferase family protein [Enhydrobacter sp.]|nr:lysophospholipid acyltransferase family protein [Enhydrobacter sp.]